MAESDNTSVFHIKKIHMENWWIFPGETNLEFKEDKMDPVIAFIGVNNCGKTIVLSSLEIAANCLKCLLPDTTGSTGSDLSSILDPYQAPGNEWPYMNKFEKKGYSLFAAEMSGEVIFGLYSPGVRGKWDWKEDDEPNPSVCFLLHRSRLYSVRRRHDCYELKFTHDCYELKFTDLKSGEDYCKKLNDSDTEWKDGEENMEKFCEIVKEAVPWCVVNEERIRDIYSGRYVGDNVEGMQQKPDEMMADNATSQEFRFGDIPSGYKFLGYAKNVMDMMPARKCLVLEEPTRCMHPAMIREFLLTLIDECKKKNFQVIMSTHAPTAVEYLPLSNVFLFSRLKDTEAEVQCVLPVDEKLLYPQRWLIPCLFARQCVLVEGPTDQRILERLFPAMLNKEHDHILENVLSDKPEQERKRITTAFRNCVRDSVVVDVKGKGNIRKYCNDLIRLGIPHVIICDGDTIFGGKADEMRDTINLTNGDLQKKLEQSETLKKKGILSVQTYWAGKKGDAGKKLCSGVTEPDYKIQNIVSADGVWDIAEKGNIFCPSHEGKCDLESLIGNRFNKHDIAYTCKDEEITDIIQGLFTEKKNDIKRFFIFLTEFANKLSTVDPPTP